MQSANENINITNSNRWDWLNRGVHKKHKHHILKSRKIHKKWQKYQKELKQWMEKRTINFIYAGKWLLKEKVYFEGS